MKKLLLPLLLFLLISTFANAQTNCSAAFDYNVNGNNVQFYPLDSTVLTQRHFWNFGDGTTLIQNSPSSGLNHQYDPGTYNVIHIVYDSSQNCRDTMARMITINYTPACAALFYTSRDSFQLNKLKFISTSTNVGGSITGYSWKINGASVANNNFYFLDTILPAGNYQVCLTFQTSLGCSATFCDSITVAQQTPCNLQTNFNWQVFGINTQQLIFAVQPFTPGYFYKWIFGDGDNALQNNPVHYYHTAGTYTVKLITRDSASNCVDTVTKAVSVSAYTPDTCSIRISYSTNQSGITQLVANSAHAITSYQWYIDSNVISQSSPNYLFSNVGYHGVCVIVTTASGCVAQRCDTIFVGPGIAGRINDNILSYPNPSVGTSKLYLNLDMERDALVALRVYNRMGNTVSRQAIRGRKGRNVIQIPAGVLSSGQYFVEIFFDNDRKRSTFLKL